MFYFALSLQERYDAELEMKDQHIEQLLTDIQDKERQIEEKDTLIQQLQRDATAQSSHLEEVRVSQYCCGHPS